VNGLLSILLIADRNTTGIESLDTVVGSVARNVDDYDLLVVANGCSSEVYEAISARVARMTNAKLVKLSAGTDPDLAMLEGLQRCIGDQVFVGSLRDAALHLIPDMLRLTSDGHEIVVAQPRVGGTTYSPNRLDYGTRLMTRAAVHFVMHAGTAQKSAYHLLTTHPLFTPALITYEAAKKPSESLIRGLRRRWRALVSSQVGPLRLVSGMALFGALANVVYSLYILGVFIVKDGVAPGWATLSLQSAGMYLLFSIALFVLTEYLVNMIRSGLINRDVRVEREIRSKTVTYDRENLERV